MSTRIYDASQITKRKGEKAVANSFLTRIGSPNNQTGSAPLLGIYDSSIINTVKNGHMTKYARYQACEQISPGCPCPQLNASVIPAPISPDIPGDVSDILFTVGSIVVSWKAPTKGKGPFTYRVTPYLNKVALPYVETPELSYKFDNLEEWQPYTFTVCAMNAVGQGGVVPSSTYFLAPPKELSAIMAGVTEPQDMIPALKYVINAGLDTMLDYAAKMNFGPTRCSRMMYLWVSSIVGAWNWIRSESEAELEGVHDNWDWNVRSSNLPLNDNDSIIWLCSAVDRITPYFVLNGYQSIYNCAATIVDRVKLDGQWNSWEARWKLWADDRQLDGSVAASVDQPTDSVNWGRTIVVDGTTVNDINAYGDGKSKWTRLTVLGKKQGYLTYNWGDVRSTCLDGANMDAIEAGLAPKTGVDRDVEIDVVKDITGNLNDTQKVTAEFWAGGPGTVSPPLMFVWMWKEHMRALQLLSLPKIVYSMLDLVIHLFEGGRITWALKKKYMEDRPIQEIRRRFMNTNKVKSWNGDVRGSQWVPYQASNFITPPFADFPSGHSHFSKTFALTMQKWFGNDIDRTLRIYYDRQTLMSPLFKENQSGIFGEFTVAPGVSEVQPNRVPAAAVKLVFTKWEDMASSAGLSRLYGGIHCYTAHSASQVTAERANVFINDAWKFKSVTTPPVITP